MPRPNLARHTTNRDRHPALRRLLPRGLVVKLGEAGVDVDAIARAAGLDLGAIELPVTESVAVTFLSRAFLEVPPWFGLTLGFDVRPELWGVVGLAVMSSPTFGAALARLARYKHAVTGDDLELLARGEEVVVRIHLADHDVPYARQKLDAELAFLVALGRRLTRTELRPLRIDIELSQPSYHEQYPKLFGCAVGFDRPSTEVAFRTADLELPLTSANRSLAELLTGHASELLPELAAGPSVAQRVRVAVRDGLDDGVLDVGRIARRLHLSERSLQRRLREEGTSFQRVVDELRSTLADRYLRDHALSLAEISFLLGFAHPNSFFRAFKRWTGTTPDEYRAAIRGDDAAAPADFPHVRRTRQSR